MMKRALSLLLALALLASVAMLSVPAVQAAEEVYLKVWTPQEDQYSEDSWLFLMMEKFEKFRFRDYRITNFEMESSAVAGLSALLGHKALTVCLVIANRIAHQANTGYKNTLD